MRVGALASALTRMVSLAIPHREAEAFESNEVRIRVM